MINFRETASQKDWGKTSVSKTAAPILLTTSRHLLQIDARQDPLHNPLFSQLSCFGMHTGILPHAKAFPAQLTTWMPN